MKYAQRGHSLKITKIVILCTKLASGEPGEVRDLMLPSIIAKCVKKFAKVTEVSQRFLHWLSSHIVTSFNIFYTPQLVYRFPDNLLIIQYLHF